jgi:hypothetical protein
LKERKQVETPQKLLEQDPKSSFPLIRLHTQLEVVTLAHSNTLKAIQVGLTAEEAMEILLITLETIIQELSCQLVVDMLKKSTTSII